MSKYITMFNAARDFADLSREDSDAASLVGIGATGPDDMEECVVSVRGKGQCQALRQWLIDNNLLTAGKTILPKPSVEGGA